MRKEKRMRKKMNARKNLFIKSQIFSFAVFNDGGAHLGSDEPSENKIKRQSLHQQPQKASAL